MSNPDAKTRSTWLPRIFGVVLALVGLVLLVGGVQLATLGGSWYYLIAGLVTLVAGVLLWQRKALGAWLYLAVVVATVLWALAEVGTHFWGLVPRLAPVLVLGAIAAFCLRGLKPTAWRRWGMPALVVQLLVLVAGGFAVFVPHDTVQNSAGKGLDILDQRAVVSDAQSPDNRWTHYGRDADSARFAPFDQINKQNVNRLEVAWTYRTGADTTGPNEDQNTPIQVGDTLYLCTPQDKVIALDAETGQEKWKFDPQAGDSRAWNRCRGVAYYDMPQALHTADGQCNSRIITTAKDARMFALDAKTGQLCPGFGEKGVTDLRTGLGEFTDFYYMPTSQPLVAGDRVVVGGWVWDGRQVGEPSGVVRAYSLQTGALEWAWDLGNPETEKLPPEGRTYTKGTPNYWSSGTYDPELGLVYLPLGNATPDFWAAHRTPAMNEYSSTLVALRADTGREAWKFQTTRLDTWDYDNGTAPTLMDLDDGKGGKQKALVLATKTHQLFLLDRSNGKPLAEVQDLPAPQAVQQGDTPAAATQPWSTGMPQLAKTVLTEKDMWGATMFDQLDCRIAFKKLKYEGAYTKMSTERSMIYPGYFGGMNWGGMAFDPRTKMLIVNDIRMPQQGFLSPQAQAKEALAKVRAEDKRNSGWATHVQEGTPYQSIRSAFNSVLGLPCHQPSWGSLTAIDMTTRTIAWQVPLGTVEDIRLKGLRFTLPVPLGMPGMSGPFATAGGLSFFAGTKDYYLRAFDNATGKELWKGRLPVGGQATPMTYLSPASGRQFVVISAGGARASEDRGDYVIAYALPKP